MKKIIMGIITSITLLTAAPIDDIGELKVAGSQIVGKNGEPAHLMGMSFYHGQHKAGRDFVKRSVVEFLAKAWRSSVVRIPMMYSSEMGSGGGKGYDQDPQNSVKMVDSVVQAAIDMGIYVVVDWHEVAKIGHQTEAVAFFTDIAKRWGAFPNVIYEVFNEPTSSSWADIKAYATAVISAIREHDPDNLIVVGTRNWSQQVVEAAKDPLKDDGGNLLKNVAYALHFYASDKGHQGLRARADSAMTMGIALFATEWGNSTASGNGALNTEYMDAFKNWMLEKKLCWCNWSLSDIPETSAALRNGSWNSQGLITHVVSTDSGWADDDLSQSGLQVRNTIIETRPAYTPVQQVSVITDKNKMKRSFSILQSGNHIELLFNTAEKWNNVELLDLKGRVLICSKVNNQGPKTNMIIKNSGPGMYIVKVKNGQGTSQTVPLVFMEQ